MAAESVGKTLFVALALCVVCSVLVSSAAVILKPKQTLNRELDIKKNLLLSAGLIANSDASRGEIDAAYTKIEPLLIDLATGKAISQKDSTFDSKKAVSALGNQHIIPAAKDLARIRMRPKTARVYLVKEEEEMVQLILPVHGKGLYSTLYGFLALGADTRTVTGFSFYDHGETPGLGGEIDNPRWKAQWPGKTVYDANWQPNIQVVKGGVQPGTSSGSQVDAISGATMTSRGVENLLRYWLGEDGYGPFLARMRM